MKNVMRNTAISVGIALAIFCTVGIVFDVIYQGEFQVQGYGFTKMVIGSVVTGIGWGVPTAIYDKDHLSMGIRSIVHIGTGLIVQTIAAFLAGWIPRDVGTGSCILIVACEILFALMIWFGFYIYNINEAKKINNRIRNNR